MFRTIFFWLCLSALGLPAQAQREYANWCFGYDTIPDPRNQATFFTKFGHGAQINFGAAGPQTVGLCQAGNNSISDAQGNLLFYTNGDNIYDRRHQLMPGGAGLADATDTYCVGTIDGVVLNNVILPAPGQPGVYYVFSFRRDPTTPVPYLADNARLVYCLVDMRTGGGFGTVTRRDVVVSATNNTLHLLAVRHRNNRDFWLITRSLKERTFLAYLLTPNGLSVTPVVSPATDTTPYPIAVFTSFRVSPNGRQLFSTGCQQVKGSDGKYLLESSYCLYNFNGSSGEVSKERVIFSVVSQALSGLLPDFGNYNCGPLGSNCTAACFSPKGTFLYTIETLLPADFKNSICQYDLTLPTLAAIRASRLVLAQQVATPLLQDTGQQGRFSDLQLAPDGTIWVGDLQHRNLQRSATALIDVQPKAVSIIRNPDVAGVGCQLDLAAYPLPGRTSPAQFPNIVANMLYPATAVEAEISCTDSVRFWPNSAQSGPPGRWNFGDPASGSTNETTGYYVAHQYAHGGRYQVSLTYADGRKLYRTVDIPASEPDLATTNIFTPNNDGLNDVFQTVTRGQFAQEARLQIFSRWGQSVHKTTSPSPIWDGVGASPGQYFYQLDYSDCQGQTQHRRGWIELSK